MKALWIPIGSFDLWGALRGAYLLLLTSEFVHLRGLTFELSWHQRCGALGGWRKLGRRPCTRRPA